MSIKASFLISTAHFLLPGSRRTLLGAQNFLGDPGKFVGYLEKFVRYCTKATFTASGLTSGTRYWFRVASVNNNGQSGWSDPATKIAP